MYDVYVYMRVCLCACACVHACARTFVSEGMWEGVCMSSLDMPRCAPHLPQAFILWPDPLEVLFRQESHALWSSVALQETVPPLSGVLAAIP